MEVPLGWKPITFYSVIWKSLIFNGGGRSSSTNQLHSLHSKKNNFSFRFVHFVNCFDEMDEVKRYYNSNLYEADSYLVIIIECFCEEWTNTWNWLRGELVAELPKARGRRREWTNKEKTLSFWFVEWMSGSERIY